MGIHNSSANNICCVVVVVSFERRRGGDAQFGILLLCAHTFNDHLNICPWSGGNFCHLTLWYKWSQIFIPQPHQWQSVCRIYKLLTAVENYKTGSEERNSISARDSIAYNTKCNDPYYVSLTRYCGICITIYVVVVHFDYLPS